MTNIKKEGYLPRLGLWVEDIHVRVSNIDR